MRYHLFKENLFIVLFLVLLASIGCYAPKVGLPNDIHQLKTSEELGFASREAYQKAKAATERSEVVKYAHAGIVYSDKCLKNTPEEIPCLYYNVLNRGLYIQHVIPKYQKSLKLMVDHCETVNDLDPHYQHAGCYRVLGNIYAKAPSFTLASDGVTRDLEKSLKLLNEAVRLAPDYSLNHLFLARTMAALDETAAAKQQLAEFDRLRSSDLDKDYPEWKKVREKLARKLH